MRVGIDGRALTGRYTGDRTYWMNLVRGLLRLSESGSEEMQYVVYTRVPIPEGELPSHPNLKVRLVPAANDRLWTLATFPVALRHDGVDIAHTQYTTPLRSHCPVITTVHDISFRLYPEWFPRKHRVLLNLSVPPSINRAAKVITVSESSRRDILRVYGVQPDKVVAVPLAAGPEFTPLPSAEARDHVAQAFGIHDPFILFVGVLQPRKNVGLLLQAFAEARKEVQTPHKLVLTGKRGWAADDLERQVSRLKLNDTVIFTDYIPDSELPALYSAADAMTFPSLYEGFGLPPLEAMACGAPTVVSDSPAMPEVVGDGAWVLPAMDHKSWAYALARLMTDEAVRAKWSARGVSRAADYSWDETARRTLQVYERCLAGAGTPV